MKTRLSLPICDLYAFLIDSVQHDVSIVNTDFRTGNGMILQVLHKQLHARCGDDC
jgi:hypothetical protein